MQEVQAQAEAQVRAPKVKCMHAEGNQKFMTESLGITRGQALVANLTVFPDRAIKLVLCDPNGEIGLILARRLE